MHVLVYNIYIHAKFKVNLDLSVKSFSRSEQCETGEREREIHSRYFDTGVRIVCSKYCVVTNRNILRIKKKKSLKKNSRVLREGNFFYFIFIDGFEVLCSHSRHFFFLRVLRNVLYKTYLQLITV